MGFPQRTTDGNRQHNAHAGELMTELTLLVEQHGDLRIAADLACHDLAAVLEVCDDPALAADGDELIAQVVTLERSAARSGQRMPLAS